MIESTGQVRPHNFYKSNQIQPVLLPSIKSQNININQVLTSKDVMITSLSNTAGNSGQDGIKNVVLADSQGKSIINKRSLHKKTTTLSIITLKCNDSSFFISLFIFSCKLLTGSDQQSATLYFDKDGDLHTKSIGKIDVYNWFCYMKSIKL